MSGAVPRSRPRLTHQDALACLRGVDVSRPVLLGVRGYYRDTMGARGVNDLGIYDDCIALVTPGALLTCNANTDPSRTYPRVATLDPGVWRYQVGIHGLSKPKARQYEALVQAGAVSVTRAPLVSGGVPTRDTGWFGINIHRGSVASTSSEGCQTIVPSQWAEFMGAVRAALKAADRTVIEYVLVNGWPPATLLERT